MTIYAGAVRLMRKFVLTQKNQYLFMPSVTACKVQTPAASFYPTDIEGRKKAAWRYAALQRLNNAFTACFKLGDDSISDSLYGIQRVCTLGQHVPDLRNMIDIDSIQRGFLCNSSKLIFFRNYFKYARIRFPYLRTYLTQVPGRCALYRRSICFDLPVSTMVICGYKQAAVDGTGF